MCKYIYISAVNLLKKRIALITVMDCYAMLKQDIY